MRMIGLSSRNACLMRYSKEGDEPEDAPVGKKGKKQKKKKKKKKTAPGYSADVEYVLSSFAFNL